MTDKFKNRYRIPSSRLQAWDYGSNGSYFITICTKNREHFFGEIVEGEMKLSELGKFAEQYWIEIPTHFDFLELGDFVVMPNHIHGIIIINKLLGIPARRTAAFLKNSSSESQSKRGGFAGDKNPMLQKNISRVCRWYKGRCTFAMRTIDKSFNWQPRFHDYIIRDAESLERIQYYIVNNPRNWEEDKFHT